MKTILSQIQDYGFNIDATFGPYIESIRLAKIVDLQHGKGIEEYFRACQSIPAIEHRERFIRWGKEAHWQ